MLEFKCFRKITIEEISKKDLLDRLAQSKIQFNEYAHVLFEHPSFENTQKSETIELVKVQLHEFQIAGPLYYANIVNGAKELGLALCPLVLAGFLRLAYLDQKEGPYLTIASERPENNDDFPSGFYLRKLEGILWLRGYRATSDYEWPSESEFIFKKI